MGFTSNGSGSQTIALSATTSTVQSVPAQDMPTSQPLSVPKAKTGTDTSMPVGAVLGSVASGLLFIVFAAVSYVTFKRYKLRRTREAVSSDSGSQATTISNGMF